MSPSARSSVLSPPARAAGFFESRGASLRVSGTACLLLIVLACGLFFARETDLIRRQKRLVEFIRSGRGAVAYDWEVDSQGKPTGLKGPRDPQWLIKLAGSDMLHGLREIKISSSSREIPDETFEEMGSQASLRQARFRGARIGHEQFALLRGLNRITVLELDSTQITDSGVARLGLQAFEKLERLSLAQTAITNESLKSIKKARNLTELFIDMTSIDDEGIAELRDLVTLRVLAAFRTNIRGTGLEGFDSLETLSLVQSKVDDAGLAVIARLRRLRYLGLSGCKFTDRGLAPIAQLDSLEALGLDQTEITDAGLETLADQKSLASVSVSMTQITDQGLELLCKNPSLKFVSAYRCPGVTPAGVKRIQQTAPGS